MEINATTKNAHYHHTTIMEEVLVQARLTQQRSLAEPSWVIHAVTWVGRELKDTGQCPKTAQRLIFKQPTPQQSAFSTPCNRTISIRFRGFLPSGSRRHLEPNRYEPLPGRYATRFRV